jgi:hypothetical protein
MNQPNELPIPPMAQTAGSRELLRVWAAGGKQHVSLATGLWKDPATWGIVLVDLMKHVSSAYEQTAGLPADETFQRIISGMQAELAESTDNPTGELLQ